MRFGITLGLTHKGQVEVVDGPGDPMELNKKFKKIAGAGKKTDPKFAELHLHEMSISGGRKRITFADPNAKKAKSKPTAEQKKARAEARKKEAADKKAGISLPQMPLYADDGPSLATADASAARTEADAPSPKKKK